jgi:hypothetical protein
VPRGLHLSDLKQVGWIYKVTYTNGLEDRKTNVVVPEFGQVSCALLILQRSWPGALVRKVESAGPLYEELQYKGPEPDKAEPGPTKPPYPVSTVDTMVRQERPATPPMPVQHEWSYISWANQYQCLQCRIVVNTREDGDTLRCDPPESPNPYEEVTHRSHPADVPRAAGGYAEPNYHPTHQWTLNHPGGRLVCGRCGTSRVHFNQAALEECRRGSGSVGAAGAVSPAPGFHDSHDWVHNPATGQAVCKNCATYRKSDNPSAGKPCKPSRQAQAYLAGLRQPAPDSPTPIPPEEDC